jgi:uroporphyrinogen decarboxylase
MPIFKRYHGDNTALDTRKDPNPYPDPDFRRVRMSVGHIEPDRVPLIDAAISYEIMGRFIGRQVNDDDLQLQVEFFNSAGYDYVPVTAGMMQPGKVTKDSSISKVLQDKTDREDK